MNTSESPVRHHLLRALSATALILALPFLTACGSSSADITGVWQPDDGSGIKTVNADGSCTGMYYDQGQPLDIGGGMSCALGEKDQGGEYLLVVRQPPNERTYRVRFDGSDTAVLMDNSGNTIVTLTRQ